MDCSGVSFQNPPIARGPLQMTEGLVLLAYFGTIILLFAGPSHVAGRLWRKRNKEPPWYLEKTVYSPLVGLTYVALINYLRGRSDSLVTSMMIRQVCIAKGPIIALIMSFAYMSISLDFSGFFLVTAGQVVRLANGNGPRLLVYVVLLCAILAYLTSNDIVIVSLTPLLCHIGNHSRIKNLIPLLISQFVAANTSSMGLLIGSPTNIILGTAVNLSFARYFILMLPIAVTAVLATIPMLLLVFRWCPTRGIAMQRRFGCQGEGGEEGPPLPPPRMDRMDPAPRNSNTVTDSEKPKRRLLTPRKPALKAKQSTEQDIEAEEIDHQKLAVGPRSDRVESQASIFDEVVEHGGAMAEVTGLMMRPRTRWSKVALFAAVLVLLAASGPMGVELYIISTVAAGLMFVMDIVLVLLEKGNLLSFFVQVYRRMPWTIAPFVLCMFILVQVLTNTGFTGRFASWMIKAAGDSIWTQSLTYAFASALLVNCLNDLPSTVFWSDMVGILCNHYSNRSYHVVIMSLLVGLNIGCYLTIIGALAGLVWQSIIKTQPAAAKLTTPTALDLSYYGVQVYGPVLVCTCIVTCLVAMGIQ